MATANQPVDQWREMLDKILKDHAAISYSHGDIQQYVIIDADRTHFLLFNEGWDRKKRVHGCVTHVQIIGDKIWIHYDGIEDGITVELVAAGVPKDHIVLAFHPPEVREYTGYAIA